MRKLTSAFHVFAISACLIAGAMSPDSAHSATAAPKSKKTKAQQKNASVAPPGVPTALPAYKGPKKIKIDFTKSDDRPDKAKVVQSDAALDQAISDQAAARKAVEDRGQKVEAIQSIPVVEVAPENAKASPRRTEIAVSTPSPSPTPAKEDSPPMKAASQPLVSPVRETVPEAAPTTTQMATPSRTSSLVENQRPQPEPVAKATAPTVNPSAHISASGPSRRFFVRGGYLGAKYSDLESRLENGATFVGFGFGSDLGATLGAEAHDLEGRLSLDIAHGRDQAVNAQNIRMLTIRADMSYLFLSGPIRPFVGAGLGYADYDVRSYRSVKGDEIILKQHAKGGSFVLSPRAGVRFTAGSSVSVDLEAEYLALVGTSEATSLGGFSGVGSINFAF